MPIPLYNTDIIPLTSRPTLTVMDDGDYFVILDTSTGKISKILKTLAMEALKISYDNTTSGLTAETVQAALDELSSDADALALVVAGLGLTKQNISEKTNVWSATPNDQRYPTEKLVKDSLDTLDTAIETLETVVDTNRLYSDSQYLDLKAKYDAQQIALNASKAEVYTDEPILQYGATEIIGKGYEADDTPIDVSANVVDGKLSMEQKGLTIRNLVQNGDFSQGTTGWTGLGSTLSVVDGKLRITQAENNTVARVWQMFEFKSGNVYLLGIDYIKSEVTPSELSIGATSGTSGTGAYEFVSCDMNTKVQRLALRITGGSHLSFGARFNTTGTVVNNYMDIDKFFIYNLTALGLDSITDTDILAKLLSYVDGTKSVGKMGIQILDAGDAVTQTIFLPTIGNSLPNGVADSIKTVADGWEHSKRVSTPQAVLSGVAVNTTNYPTAKNAGQWVNELTAGGTEIGVVGTDSTTGAGMLRFELATPIVTKYDLPHLTSGKTAHRFAGEEKISLYGTGVTFTENVLSVLSAVKFVAGVMTDITALATITGATVTFSGVTSTDVVYVKVEHSVNRPLGILEHTPAVSNTASRLASLEARVTALEV